MSLRCLTRGLVLASLAGCLLPTVSSDIAATEGSREQEGASGRDTALKQIRELLDQHKDAEAERQARALLAEVEVAEGRDSLAAADVLALLVSAVGRTKPAKDPEGRALAERALAIREKLLGSEHLKVAASLDALANVVGRAGDLPAARSLYERSIAIREKAGDSESPGLVKTLYNLALVQKDAGDLTGARSNMERGLEILEKIHGPNHPDVARIANSLGNTLKTMGEMAAARAQYERALAIQKKAFGEESREVAMTLSNLGSLLRMTGDYDQAREVLEESLGISERIYGAGHQETLPVVNNLANLLFEIYDYVGARPLYERVLAGTEREYGGEAFQTGTALRNLANLLFELGDFEKSRSMHERALAIFEATRGPEHPTVALSLHNIAELLRVAGDLATAKPLFERSLRIREKAQGPEHADVARSLRGLGFLMRDTGNLDGAKALLERALRIREKALGPDHPFVGGSLTSLGDVLRMMGDYAGAEPLFQRAIAIQDKTLGPEHIEPSITRSAYALLLLRKGEAEAAAREALHAEGIAVQQFRQTARSLTEREALRYEASRNTGLDVAFSAIVHQAAAGGTSEHIGAAWDAVIRSRAMVMDEMASRHRFLATRAGEVEELEKNLAGARSRLARLLFMGPNQDKPGEYPALILHAQEEKERAERALAEKDLYFRREISRVRIGFSDVVKTLQANEALVAYLQYTRTPGPGTGSAVPSYLAMIVSPGRREPVLVPLGESAAIDSLVTEWRRAAGTDPRSSSGSTESAYRKSGEKLRHAIWDPVTGALQGSRLVFIVPDGLMNLVNFGALPDGSKGYLVETATRFHYLSAERDLVPEGHPGSAGSGILIVGAPDFNAKSDRADVPPARPGAAYRGSRASCGGFRELRFDPLPAAHAEAETIRSIWEKGPRSQPEGQIGAMALEGIQADEATFKAAAPGRRILHLATHGFFVQEGCPSALQIARAHGGGTRAGDEPLPSLGDSPLLLTGLALAGANLRNQSDGGGEDGILTAEEIASLDLSGVDWAVLSACETGLGKVVSGEGVLGLRRAFEVAGARTLIMSLWSVEDDATRVWMRGLYEARQSGESTVEAVRSASLRVIEAQRRRRESTHPFFWGGFVAAGDWR